LTKTNRAV